MTKKIFSLICLLALTMPLVACGGDDAVDDVPEEAPTEAPAE